MLTARLNARLNGVRVRALRGHLFEPVRRERFDCVVSNPPYVPSTQAALPRSGARRAWEAGTDGRVILDRIIDEAADHLRPNGVLVLTHSNLIGEQETLERLRANGFSADLTERRRGPLGPLMRRKQQEGAVPAGIAQEDVLIVRAVRCPQRAR